jgi:DNA-binding beta-propeller fold protein YncE
MVLDSSGRLYVVDVNNNRIIRFLADGTFDASFNASGTEGWGIAIDESLNRLYATNATVVNVISVFDLTTGTNLSNFSFSGFGIFGGLAVDSLHNVYFYAQGISEIRRINSSGILDPSWSVNVGERTGYGLYIAPGGLIGYGSTSETNSLFQFTIATQNINWMKNNIVGATPAALRFVAGIFGLPDSSIMVADSGDARVLWLDANGNYLCVFGNPGDYSDAFYSADGVACANGNLYVSDQTDIRIFHLCGQTSTTTASNVASSMVRRPVPTRSIALGLPPGKSLISAPNPAGNESIAVWRLDTPGQAQLKLYDLTGRLVLNRNLGQQPAGVGQASLNLANMASGIYYLILEANQGQGWHVLAHFKMAVVK